MIPASLRFCIHLPSLAGALSVGFAGIALSPALADEQVWDIESPELSSAPKYQWISKDEPIRSLLYEGLPYQGGETEVFAFYASPATIGTSKADAATKFPGVVLIHGGGGTAFSEWVWLWAQRGYAAIAMDLSGHRPPAPQFDKDGNLKLPDLGRNRDQRTLLEKPGPDQGHSEKFDSIGGDHTDDWPWHAVSNVIRAHSLIRSFDEVDSNRTAVTGISWGGYTTCIVASIDSRFQAAVPVYGCGFLFEGESVQKKSIDALDPDRRSEWIRRYDPSSHLGKCQVPIFFVNGTHDVHYPLDSYQKSFGLVPAEKLMRIELRMGHSHPAGWAPSEIARFIDSYCLDGPRLPFPGKIETSEDGKITFSTGPETRLKSATLHYTTDTGLRSERTWQKAEASIDGSKVIAPAPPKEANTWLITVTDEKGHLISTPVQFAP